ncbi:aa3-type cytochrome c oxidase subunit IV [Methylobacterium radiodurans]|uniref:Aa3-type cytochrome c oxidase subunit IV n=1 Tax=Methylobacterium radiodurans TaxID=2202828 RepID=A0A2U8VRD1_9HYPH|nr:aa3-type cytochrome c oxidase subunit IV [Methylobacterium radiodurans]AWN36329.1 aa3-type cytochrome c oxidase subunit IV [Methylobacterium radiodurans]
MADTKTVSGAAYSPAMDAKTHEQTYRGFIRFVEIATGVVICWVLALAVGGIREAWLTAIAGVVAASVAGAVGALAPAVGWKAPLVVGLLLALYLAFA